MELGRRRRRSGAAEKPQTPLEPRELPEGAIVCGVAGLVLSILVKVGDSVAEGDDVAMLEIMKMRRNIVSTRRGVVKEIWAHEGQMVDAEDVLMVVA